MTRAHGTYYGYTSGCRCGDCTTASTRMKKRWRLKREAGIPVRVPSIGAKRRIRSLVAGGWPLWRIADQMGDHSRGTVGHILYRAGDTITKTLSDRVTAAYDHLSASPGPSSRSRIYGQSMGWVPPLAWGDDIDHPAATPVVAEDPIRSQLDLDEWWMLVQAGEDPQRASNRCGVLVGTVERAAQRAGRKDIAAAAAAARHQARWGTAA